MAALRVGRVNLLRRRVLVAASVMPVSGGLEWGDTKGHERREVAIPPLLIEDLARHVEGHNQHDLLFASGADVKMVQQMMGPQVGDQDARSLRAPVPDRLDVVADAMDPARASALSTRHQSGTGTDGAGIYAFPK